MHFCNEDILIEVIIDFLGPVMTLAKNLINSLIHYLLLLVVHEFCWFRLAMDYSWRPLDNEKIIMVIPTTDSATFCNNHLGKQFLICPVTEADIRSWWESALCTLITSWLFHYKSIVAGVQRQNDKNCVTFQILEYKELHLWNLLLHQRSWCCRCGLLNVKSDWH